MGQKRQIDDVRAMSACPPIATELLHYGNTGARSEALRYRRSSSGSLVKLTAIRPRLVLGQQLGRRARPGSSSK
jgi:hypothetical protein